MLWAFVSHCCESSWACECSTGSPQSCCSVLRCVAVCCDVLQRVAMMETSPSLLRVKPLIVASKAGHVKVVLALLRRVAVCCGVLCCSKLQCVAMCSSQLQFVAERCSVL